MIVKAGPRISRMGTGENKAKPRAERAEKKLCKKERAIFRICTAGWDGSHRFAQTNTDFSESSGSAATFSDLCRSVFICGFKNRGRARRTNQVVCLANVLFSGFVSFVIFVLNRNVAGL